MTLARSCRFCGESRVGTGSKEHIFHDSFRKSIPHSPKLKLTRYEGGLDTEPVDETVLPITMFDRQIGGVCRECNSGWMNEIDLAIEPQIVALANSRSDTLPSSQIAAFARWAYKIALLRPELDRSKNGQLDEDLAPSFYRERLPPSSVHILIGRTRQPLFESGYNSYTGLRPDPDSPTLRFNSIGWGMGQLYTLVLVGSTHPYVKRGLELRKQALMRYGAGDLQAVWPRRRRGPIRLGRALTRDEVFDATNIEGLTNALRQAFPVASSG